MCKKIARRVMGEDTAEKEFVLFTARYRYGDRQYYQPTVSKLLFIVF